MIAAGGPELLAGLVVFSAGLAVFVFPRAIVDEVGDRIDVGTGHRATVAARTVALATMAAGLVLLLL